MENSELKKNIIIIRNSQEKLLENFSISSTNYNLIQTDVDAVKVEIVSIKNKERCNNLIIVDKEFYSDEIRKKLKSLFVNAFGYSNPHILFLSNKFYSHEEHERIISEQNFFYHLSKEKDAGAFSCYVTLIMQHIEDLKRLDNYIIHSFQTIVNSELISQQKSKIESLYKQLETLSKIDILTNVLNRRAFFDAMEVEKSRALRDLWRLQNSEVNKIDLNSEKAKTSKKKYTNKPSGEYIEHFGKFSCLMIDIDNFKLINDTYGHQAGDEVLRRLGTLLGIKTIFREIDIIGRYGGEEFIVLLPETSSKDARKPAKRLADGLKKINFNFNNQVISVTISIGISEFRITDKFSDEIIQRADKALYYAKNNGKDMIVVYEDIYKD